MFQKVDVSRRKVVLLISTKITNLHFLLLLLKWLLSKSNMIMHFREGNNLTPPIMNDTSYQTAFVALTNVGFICCFLVDSAEMKKKK